MISYPLGIVLYNPTSNSINRILAYANDGIIIFVFDNSSTCNEKLKDAKNIKYHFFNKNLGLSYSIDFLCKQALRNNYNKLLFFDQDTIFNLETLLYVENFISFKESQNNIFFQSVLSVNFREKNVDNNLNIIDVSIIDSYTIFTTYFNINSGTLFFLNYFSSFKWFDMEYFVDGVDYSFSLNTIINKFKNISISNVPGLNHTDEQGDSIVKFFNKNFISRIYPINRNYDFLKSHILILFKSFKIKSIRPKLFILRAIVSYVFVQLLFRIQKLLS